MAKKNINKRCPFSMECGRDKCMFDHLELGCDYYYNNAMDDNVIPDQEERRRMENEMIEREKEERLLAEIVEEETAAVPARVGEIAMEINFIKRRAAEGLLKDAIEIGRLLCEAKEQVPHGAWGKWLEVNVSYSTSTANNMMRLYNEQERAAQLDMFGDNGFEMFEGLAPSKVLELMQLPSVERKSFVESHDVENMSVRNIKAEIKAEKKAREQAEAEVSELKGQVADAKKAVEEEQLKVSIAEDARRILADKLDEATRALEEKDAEADATQKAYEDLTEKLAEAQAQLAAERTKIIPLSPEERAEIETAAQKAAEEAAAKKIEAAKKNADKELKKARAKGAEAVKKVEAERDAAIQKAKEEAKAEAERATAAKVAELEEKIRSVAAIASPYRVKFGTCLEALQAAYGRMVAVVEEAEREDPTEGELLRRMLSQVVTYLKG